MERSEIRGLVPQLSLSRIALRSIRATGGVSYPRTAASPNGGGAKPALEA
jgi:hypothetical protein